MKKILLALLLMPLFTNAQDTTGLIAHWAMNGDAKDASGHGHNGRTHNLTATTGYYGKPNTAYYFNGSTTSFFSTDTSSAYNTNIYTICMVIKINGFYSGPCEGNQLFSKGTPSQSSSSTTGHYSFGFQDNPYNSCGIFDSTKEVFYSQAGNNIVTTITNWRDTPQLVENQWYKVIASYDSLAYRIYINGTLRRTIPWYVSPIGSSVDSVVLGLDVWEAGSGYPFYFKGVMDDAKLYKRVLTDTEIVHYGDTCGKISLQPTPVALGVGLNATFTVGSNLYPSPNYQWQQNSGSGFTNLTNAPPYSGVTTASMTITGITAAMSGYKYRCIVANSWGCTDTSQFALLTVTNGVNNVVYNSPLVSVYPNPAKNNITIELPGNEGATVQIINVIGQQVIEKTFTGINTQIDMSAIPAGVYIVRVKYNDFIITRKLLKE